jgi:hypothetical protein
MSGLVVGSPEMPAATQFPVLVQVIENMYTSFESGFAAESVW